MILLKKIEFFYLLFLSSIGLERVFADFLDRKANNNPTNFACFEKGIKSIVFVKNLKFIELLLVCKIGQGKLSGAF